MDLSQKKPELSPNDIGLKRYLELDHIVYHKLEYHQDYSSFNLYEKLAICYCIKGSLRLLTNQKIIPFGGNDIIIIPPNTSLLKMEKLIGKGEVFWVTFDLFSFKKDNNYSFVTNLRYLTDALQDISLTTFKGSIQFAKFLKELKLCFVKSQDPLLLLSIDQMIVQLLLETLKLSSEDQKISKTEVIRLEYIYDYINKNMHKTISLEELAASIDLSVSYFKTWFKEKVGIPPKEYINRLKIERAKTDLEEKLSITDVAFDLGFSTTQYFSSTFKKYTGQSPRSYIIKKRIKSKTRS